MYKDSLALEFYFNVYFKPKKIVEKNTRTIITTDKNETQGYFTFSLHNKAARHEAYIYFQTDGFPLSWPNYLFDESELICILASVREMVSVSIGRLFLRAMRSVAGMITIANISKVLMTEMQSFSVVYFRMLFLSLPYSSLPWWKWWLLQNDTSTNDSTAVVHFLMILLYS